MYLDFKEKSGEETNLSEIVNFLRHSNKVYDLGRELMIGIKKQIGVKLSDEKELLAKDYLQTKTPDIRKLWTDCDNLKTEIYEDKKKIREYIKNKSRGGIPIYTKLDKGFDSVVFHKNELCVMVGNTGEEEIYKLVNDFVANGKLTEDEEYKEFVEAIIKDKPLYEMLERVRVNIILLGKKNTEYNKWLDKMKKLSK